MSECHDEKLQESFSRLKMVQGLQQELSQINFKKDEQKALQRIIGQMEDAMIKKDEMVAQNERFIKAQHMSIRLRERRAQKVLSEFADLESRFKTVCIERNNLLEIEKNNISEIYAYR